MKLFKKIKRFIRKHITHPEPIFYDSIPVYVAPSGTHYVHLIDLLLTPEEKKDLCAQAKIEAKKILKKNY
ncbi:MAG: hypothetical protein COU47_00030 [Candidatus Niyogibacteria bacterium CG10_big_fil_rev_8_21_14_0_10_46_36]|uniref:Uncharacterized protein n=1 Tax=Candidatus Niyogibacteria bacterium CG10_big_fil_rev_8_21_14_0_10_46_36 TaxID=1974726 RepID=A0A2H0TFT8_9BACT|nr:MAG: hypothetical protein COU47_00030 [Candidatus Niyogibacteria bacterium CG10_big_fil_rev_8_21_14_0_10_46_36]